VAPRRVPPPGRSRAGSDPARGAPGPAHRRIRLRSPLLKRRFLGTNRGSVRPHDVDNYLGEFRLRYKPRPNSPNPAPLVNRLIQEVARGEPIPLKAIVGGDQGRTATECRHATRALRSVACGVAKQ
jgi:hypothetical protein